MRNFTREKEKPGASRTRKAIAAAIRLGDTIHNPAIKGDKGWNPLAVTAPDPSYPGAHSTLSEAAATVLSAFGGSRVRLAITLGGVTRTLGGQVAAFVLGHFTGRA